MVGKLVIRGAYQSDKPGEADLETAFEKFTTQIGRDVLTGTFDDFDKSIFISNDAFEKFKADAKAASRAYSELESEAARVGKFQFRLELDASLFSDPDYGLQRLVHTLASDLFERRVHKYQGKVSISEIDFGPVKGAMEAAYRTKSYNVSAIRKELALAPNRPLLAFSFKPRSCVTAEDYLSIAEAAFRNGCNIVELDTRDLSLDRSGRLELFLRLSKLGLACSKGRICRFAVNLSGPARIVGPILEEISRVHSDSAPDGPWVVKIDGNLDGLSTIQAIRSGSFRLHKQPIITSYPSLKYALQPALGRNAFVQMLAMSGADIIYPGQSPDFGQSNNRIEPQKVAAAQKHYKAMDLGGYPMLSVAGGIAINSVHACLSVLGPDIAFFTGGGIALSKKGIDKGAKNFSEAIELSCKDLFDQVPIKNLVGTLVDLSKIYFDEAIPENYELIMPKALEHVPLVAPSKNMSD